MNIPLLLLGVASLIMLFRMHKIMVVDQPAWSKKWNWKSVFILVTSPVLYFGGISSIIVSQL